MTARWARRLRLIQRYISDALVIATGAEPVRPPIPGVDLDGVHFLHTMQDSFRVHERVGTLRHGRVLVIGGGYIGLEMADAFTYRGLNCDHG